MKQAKMIDATILKTLPADQRDEFRKWYESTDFDDATTINQYETEIKDIKDRIAKKDVSYLREIFLIISARQSTTIESAERQLELCELLESFVDADEYEASVAFVRDDVSKLRQWHKLRDANLAIINNQQPPAPTTTTESKKLSAQEIASQLKKEFNMYEISNNTTTDDDDAGSVDVDKETERILREKYSVKSSTPTKIKSISEKIDDYINESADRRYLYTEKLNVTGSNNLLCNGLDFFDGAVEDLKKSSEPVPTGFKRLDAEIGVGLIGGSVYCIAGTPGCGKTTYILQIAKHIAQSNHYVMLYSLELTRAEIYARLMSLLSTGIARKNRDIRELHQLELERWTDKDRKKIVIQPTTETFNKYDYLRFNSYTTYDVKISQGRPVRDVDMFLVVREALATIGRYMQCYTDTYKLADVKTESAVAQFLGLASKKDWSDIIDEWQNLKNNSKTKQIYQDWCAGITSRKYDRDFGIEEFEVSIYDFLQAQNDAGIINSKPTIFIDYLQLIRADGATEKEKLDKISKGVKRLSKEFNVPIVVVSSVGRDFYDKKFDISAVKESGGIEFEFDFVAGLQLSAIEHNTKKTTNIDTRSARAEMPRHVSLVIQKNRDNKNGGIIDYEYFADQNYFAEYKDTVDKFNNAIAETYKDNEPGPRERHDDEVFKEYLRKKFSLS